jgi:nicotinamide mononucleotide transporter
VITNLAKPRSSASFASFLIFQLVALLKVEASYPLIDALTTCFAIITTFMVAHKVLENWIYWIVIDAVSIFLYLDKALWFTAILFAIYIVLAIIGFVNWRNKYRIQKLKSIE